MMRTADSTSYITFFQKLSKLSMRLVAGVFFVYLTLGNFPRFISLPGFFNNILATELVLYAVCFFSVFFVRLDFRFSFFLFCCAFFVSFSAFYGSLIQQFNLVAVVHAIRLLLFIFCGIQLGRVFFSLYRNLVDFAIFFLRSYLFSLVLGLVIYVFFSMSKEFWIFLSQMGIVFFGDPHESRFISVYFDPNFYGAIGCIPFMISFFLFKESNKKKYFLYACLFSATILLTLSRSGIATFFVLACYVLRKNILNLRFFVVNRILVVFVFSFFLLLVFVAFMQRDSFEFFFSRTANIACDPSALARFENFQQGLELFRTHPVLGIGYNYIPYYDFVLDSSLLMTFVCFGLIPSIFLFCVIGVFLYVKIQKIKRSRLFLGKDLFMNFVFYTVVIVFFSSHFNNIIYYQFWLIPILAFLSFMSLECSRIPEVSNYTEIT